MAKISLISNKYIIHATIEIEGVVDRPDVIGAIFGQTEGLLGADLELRELQRSGRIGRIEVQTDTKGGKTRGTIIIPSSLDKAETAIIGAALEIIQRIGPCNAKVRVNKIEDVRISKRNFVVTRAKELLRTLMDDVMPDSREIADEVAYSVRVMECRDYGRDRLPAGPFIDESEEIILVEGRADVLTLLKHGFKNVISMNGTSVPKTIIELSHKKEVTVFVDGDRGGNLIIKDLLNVADVDFITKAPDGKEVEELTKKEIHKALRSKITAEQAKLEMASMPTNFLRKPMMGGRKPAYNNSNNSRNGTYQNRNTRPTQNRVTNARPSTSRSTSTRSAPTRTSTSIKSSKPALKSDEKTKFNKMLEELIGTKGAYLLDNKLAILGKVPISELSTTVKSLGSGIHAIVFDGVIDKPIVDIAEKSGVKHVVGMSTKVKVSNKLNIFTVSTL